MIDEASVKREARSLRVDPLAVDCDHALGVVLFGLSTLPMPPAWVFKGGTCLRKLHYPGYRFSEDLDFTVLDPLDAGHVERRLAEVAERAAHVGVVLDVDGMKLEAIDDDHGRESIEVRVPYVAALQMGGNRPAIRLHLSADEILAFRPVRLPLHHPFDDAALCKCEVVAYGVEEVLAEKLRAVAGQRRFTVARDVYDVWQLVERGADVAAASAALPGKAAHKKVELTGCAERFEARRAEYAASWERHVAYLVPGEHADAFDTAFVSTLAVLRGLPAVSEVA